MKKENKKDKNPLDEYIELLEEYDQGTEPIPSWHQNGGE